MSIRRALLTRMRPDCHFIVARSAIRATRGSARRIDALLVPITLIALLERFSTGHRGVDFVAVGTRRFGPSAWSTLLLLH